jgi:hypothetical protein
VHPATKFPEISAADLASELRTTRKHGIRAIEDKKPHLAALARRLADDPSLPVGQLAAAAVEEALRRYDDETAVKAIRLLLRVDPLPDLTTTSSSDLEERRKCVSTFAGALASKAERDREDSWLDELAEQLAALLLAHEAPSDDSEIEAETPSEHTGDEPPQQHADNTRRLRRPRRVSVLAALTFVVLLAVGVWLLKKRDQAPAAHTPQTSIEAMVGTAQVGRSHKFSRKPLTATVGSDVTVELSYSNLAPDHSDIDALNVSIRPDIPRDVSRTHSIAFAVDASNSEAVDARAIVRTAQPSRLIFVPGSVRWRHDIDSSMRPRWVAARLPDSTILRPSTVVERDQFAGNDFSQTLAFKLRVISA